MQKSADGFPDEIMVVRKYNFHTVLRFNFFIRYDAASTSKFESFFGLAVFI